jgi:hypothetical protein
MEVTMATVIHHHHVTTAETSTGLYWAIGAVIVLMLGLLFYFSTGTSTTELADLAMPMLPPVTPFIPLM